MAKSGNKIWRYFKRTLLVFGILLLGFLIYFFAAIVITKPEIKDQTCLSVKRLNPQPNHYTLGNNWLKKNEFGLWEMYVEGDGFERGVAIGKLTQELAEKQETAFITQIKKLVPSDGYLTFLKFFVGYFNRKLPEHIIPEYQQEIYGVSLFASDKYDYLAPKYYRILNYHAAHDIGHALQDKNMTVGCTSFSARGNKSEDHQLIIGRNFDFYSGDEFAENKIIVFCAPKTGYDFSYITWAGFTGVVSGMNSEGLTVTINASKSEIPTSAATPISLLAKEILQYAKNKDEALAIAKKRKIFVSESILIGSKNDNQSFIIEKSPSKTALYSEKDDVLICSNHFQSKEFKNDVINLKNQAESSSAYRKKRMQELTDKEDKLSYLEVANILRNQKGIQDKNIGLTNEKGINQLIAHHAVIFKPSQGLLWVSTQPFQLGKFLCYDINSVIHNSQKTSDRIVHFNPQKTIPVDEFLSSKDYQNYLLYKKLKTQIQEFNNSEAKAPLNKKIIDTFIASNSEYYHTYWIVGDYFAKLENNKNAILNYSIALQKEVATVKEREQIKEAIKACQQK